MADAERLYVATDRLGVQRGTTEERHWDLATGLVHADASAPVLLCTPEMLLDLLDERLFVADPGVAREGGAPGGLYPGGGVRLAAELAWDATAAARFALDICEHAFVADRDVTLPRGRTLGEVIDEARTALADAGPHNASMFGALARLSRVRHLRRSRAVVESAALGLAREDEGEDRELSEDPAWATLAALGEAVLAALEALRLAVAPRLAGAIDAEEDRIEEEDRASGTEVVGTWRDPTSAWQTPWGAVSFGGERIPEHPPAARCAADAAERARQAIADRAGEAAAASERAWQVERLAGLLAAAPSHPRRVPSTGGR